MTQIIKVYSAAVSEKGATFYTETGDAVNIPANDPRVSDMIDKVYLAIKNNQIPVSVDLSTFTVFGEIEKSSGGLMKFFRVAKRGLAALLGTRAERSESVKGDGMVTQPVTDKEGKPLSMAQPGTEPITPKIRAALTKAEGQASKAGLSDSETTVVAVIGDTPIVGAERLAAHARAAVAQGNTKSFQNMMTRLASVAAQRKHTAQEAMMFLEKMDLPPTLDGHILAYKSLSRTPIEGVFKDNYSGKLTQGLGTFVEMDIELVDDNRRVLCSNGLHVAQRGYLGGYGSSSGSNVITLIKIKPEDVISVPAYETQKMRVRAYHIVAVLSDIDLSTIRNQKSFTDDKDNSSLLGKIVSGDHVGILNVTHQSKDKSLVVQMMPIAQYKAMRNPEGNSEPEEKIYDTSGIKPEVAHTVDSPASGPLHPSKRVDITQLNQNIINDGIDDKSKEADPLKAKQSKADAKKQREMLKARKLKAKIAQKEKAKKMTKPVFVKPTKAVEALAEEHKLKRVVTGQPSMARQAYESWSELPNMETLATLVFAKKSAKKSWAGLGFTEIEIGEIMIAIENSK